MITYNYPLTAKIFYRFINVLLSLLLLFYSIFSLIISFEKWYFIFLFLFNLLILLILNSFFIKSYKLFPFTVQIDNEKMICSNFFLSKRKLVINHKDIVKVYGGIISGWPTRPIYIEDSNNQKVGIFTNSGKNNLLIQTVLKNIPEELYKEIILKMNEKKG